MGDLRVTLLYHDKEGLGILADGVTLAAQEMMLLVALAAVQRRLLVNAIRDQRERGLVVTDKLPKEH
jgi:hypothetical protein